MPMFYIHTVAKNLLLLVIQHDAQDLIVNHSLGLFRCAPQELFHLQDRAGFAPDFAQKQ